MDLELREGAWTEPANSKPVCNFVAYLYILLASCFFMRGVMTAFLNEDGTFPVASDALNMAVCVRCQNVSALFQQPSGQRVQTGLLVGRLTYQLLDVFDCQ